MKTFKKICTYGAVFTLALLVQLGAKTTVATAATHDIDVHTASRKDEVVHNLTMKKGTSTTASYDFNVSGETVKSRTWTIEKTEDKNVVSISNATSKTCTIETKAEGVATITLKIKTNSEKVYTEKFSVSSYTDIENTTGKINTADTPFRRGATATKYEADSIRKTLNVGDKVTIKAKCDNYYYVESDGVSGYTYCEKTTALIKSIEFKDNKGKAISTTGDFILNRGLSISTEIKPSYADEGYTLNVADKNILSASVSTGIIKVPNAGSSNDGKTTVTFKGKESGLEKTISVKTNTAATITASSTTNREAKQTLSYNIKSTDKKIVSYVRTIHYADKDEVVSGKITPSYNHTEKIDYNTSYKSSFYVVLEDGSRSKDYNFQYFWVYFKPNQSGAFLVNGSLNTTLWPQKTEMILPVVDTTAEPKDFKGWVTEENSPQVRGGFRWSKITKNTTFYGRWVDMCNPLANIDNLYDDKYKVLETRLSNTDKYNNMDISVMNYFYGSVDVKGIYFGTNKNYWENDYIVSGSPRYYGLSHIYSFTVNVLTASNYYICAVDQYGNTQITELSTFTVTTNVDGKEEVYGFQKGLSVSAGNLREPSKENYTFSHWSKEKNGKNAFAKGSLTNLSGNTILYAVFNHNAAIYDSEGKIITYVSPENNTLKENELKIPQKKNYTFSHWSKKKNGENAFKNGEIKLSEDIKLYPVYNHHAALYDSQGNLKTYVSPKNNTLKENELDIPQKKNYTFSHWSYEKGRKNAFENGNIELTKDIKLYAVYVKNSYTFEDFRFGFKNFDCDKSTGHCSEFVIIGIAFAYGLDYTPEQYGKKTLGELKGGEKYDGISIRDYICQYRHNEGNIKTDMLNGVSETISQNKKIYVSERYSNKVSDAECKDVLKKNFDSIIAYFKTNSLPLYTTFAWREYKDEDYKKYAHGVVSYGMKIINNQAHIYLADCNFFDENAKTELVIDLDSKGKATGTWQYKRTDGESFADNSIYLSCNSATDNRGFISAYTVNPSSCYR